MRFIKFKKFSTLASLLVLLGCMEGMESTSAPTRSSANLSVPAQALDGSYLINHITCSGILDVNDTTACQKSRFTIADGVGSGALYHYNFVTKRVEVLREWRSVSFSDVSQGRFNFQASVTEKSNWVTDGSTPIFTNKEYSGTGDVQLGNGRLEFIDWDEDRNYRFALIFSDGRTAWDQQVAATEARAQENRDRQQSFDNGVAILTGIAAGVSGQSSPELGSPSTSPVAPLPPDAAADHCVRFSHRPNFVGVQKLNVTNVCNYRIRVAVCQVSAGSQRCPSDFRARREALANYFVYLSPSQRDETTYNEGEAYRFWAIRAR